MRILAMLGCMAMALLAIPWARAATTAQVVGTWPEGSSVTLGQNRSFYIHIRYHSDEPTHFWAAPYGGSGHVGTNPSRIYPAGDGEAMVWFFFTQQDDLVDGVTITAGDGSKAGTHVVIDYPVQVFSSQAPATATTEPAWVATMRQQDQAAQDAASREAMNAPTTMGDALLIYGFMFVVAGLGIFSLAAPAWGLWRWRGGWRIAAALPAAIMVFVVLRIIVDGLRDPTSHNLWPFEILQAGAISAIIIIVLMVARRITRSGRTA